MSEINSVLSENEPIPADKMDSGEYSPTDAERKLLKKVDKLFQKAKKHRKKYDEKWLEYYKFFRGKQWKEQRPSYRHSEVINFVFQAIQSQVPVLTDARPKFDFLPQNPSDTEFCAILSEVAASDWDKKNWAMTLCETVYDAHFYGTGLASMEFKADQKNPIGGIEFWSKDPCYCYPDPEAIDVNKKARFFIEAEPMDVDVVKKEYPDKAKFIKADVSDIAGMEKTDLDTVKYQTPTDSRSLFESNSSDKPNSENEVLKITCYMFDDEIIEDEKDKEDGSKEYVQRLKYPNGRKVCIASNVILSDGPNPYDDGLIPYAKLVNYMLPREFWGISEVENLMSPQKIFNKLVSYALDVLTLMGNPIWVVGTGSGVDTDLLVNRPGLVVEADNIDQVRRQEGVQLQPYVLQLIDRMQNWFQEISGRTDVTSGAAPGGVTAASAIQELQEAAQTRLRLKSRFIDAFLQDAGNLYKNRVMQFYTAPQIVRLTENQNANKFFKFHIKTVETPMNDGTVQSQKVASIRSYGPAGQESLQDREYIINGDFDVRVTTGSSLPFAKAQKINVATQMFDRGAIDELELLKAADYPNYEAVWDRVSKAKMAQAQAEAQAQGQQNGAPPSA